MSSYTFTYSTHNVKNVKRLNVASAKCVTYPEPSKGITGGPVLDFELMYDMTEYKTILCDTWNTWDYRVLGKRQQSKC